MALTCEGQHIAIAGVDPSAIEIPRLRAWCQRAFRNPNDTITWQFKCTPRVVRPMAGVGCAFTYTSGSGSGEITGADAGSYAAARGTSDTCSTNRTTSTIGQSFAPIGGFLVERSFYAFDTSALDGEDNVTDVKLYLKVQWQAVDTTDDIYIKKCSWSAPLCDSAEANYDLARTSDVDQTWQNTGDVSAGNWYANSTTLDVTRIELAGTTYYAMCSKKDHDGDTPYPGSSVDNQERIEVYGSNSSGNEPYLSVTTSTIAQLVMV